MFYDNNIFLYTFEKFRLNLNSRFFYLKNVSKGCKKDATLTLAVGIERQTFTQINQIATFSLFLINIYKCIQT